MEKLKIPTNLYQQYLCGRYCDLQIQVENSFFRAHSCVVAASSWVLEAILESSTSDEDVSLSKLSIQLHGVTAYAISSLLGYIYTGKLPDNAYKDETKKSEVLHAAQLYKMDVVVAEFQPHNSSQVEEGNTSTNLSTDALNNGDGALPNLDQTGDESVLATLNSDSTAELEEILIEEHILQDETQCIKLTDEDIKKYVSDNITYAKEHGIIYCVICSEVFSTQSELIDHMNNHKVKYRKQPERAAATAASFVMEEDDALEMMEDTDYTIGRDVLKKKPSYKSFACSNCNGTFNGKGYLIRHYLTQHPDTIFCKFCVQTFANEESLQAHIGTHKEPKGLKSEASTGKRGRRPRIGPKTFGCTVCATTFEKRRELIKHKEAVHGILRPLHTCSLCEKQYKEKQSLRAHMRVHTGERPYVCTYCGNAFSDAKTWKDHERRHRGEKPYLCTTCGKSFTYRQSFTRHMKFHDGKRPFQCSFCGKSFVLRQNMKEHEKRHNK